MASVCHADTHIDPGVVHKLRDGHSLVRVRLQQLVDQIFGYEEQRRCKDHGEYESGG